MLIDMVCNASLLLGGGGGGGRGRRLRLNEPVTALGDGFMHLLLLSRPVSTAPSNSAQAVVAVGMKKQQQVVL